MAETLEITHGEKWPFLPFRMAGRCGPIAGTGSGSSALVARFSEGSPDAGGA